MVMRPDRYTEQAQEVLRTSQALVNEMRHTQWDVEHLVLAMLEQEGGLAPEILEKLGTAPHGVAKRFRQELKKTPTVAYAGQNIYITPRISKLQERAVAEMTRLRDDFIGIDHLLVAAVEEKEGDAPVIFREFGIEKEKVYQALQEIRGTSRVADPRAESRYQSLQKYSTDLTALAREGTLDPGYRAGGGDQEGDANPDAPDQEQSRSHRRGRCWKDGHRRGAGPTDNRRGRSGIAEGTGG